MRTCLGIVCGIIFIIACSFFVFVLNLDQTVYNASFDKQAINSSGIYQSAPAAIVEMISSGQVTTSSDQELPAVTKDILINTVKTIITPEILKKHSESIIDQTLSNKNIVTEDLSDINNGINSKMGSTFSEIFGVSVTANPSNTFIPNTVTFDKSKNQFGQSVIYHNKVLWVSLVASLLFLVLLFFSCANNYKSRFKWVGGFLIVASVFTLINFIVFRLVGFDWLIKVFNANISENWINSVSSQLIKLVSLLKIRFSLLYLYEFAVLAIFSVIFFLISALIPAKQIIQAPIQQTKPTINPPKGPGNGQKNS